jgi:hypothetical protein
MQILKEHFKKSVILNSAFTQCVFIIRMLFKMRSCKHARSMNYAESWSVYVLEKWRSRRTIVHIPKQNFFSVLTVTDNFKIKIHFRNFLIMAFHIYITTVADNPNLRQVAIITLVVKSGLHWFFILHIRYGMQRLRTVNFTKAKRAITHSYYHIIQRLK